MRPRLRWPSLRLRRWRVAKNMATCVIIFIYLVNIVLRTSVVLSYYCETDCNLKLWARPLPPEDDLIISYICHKVLDPPQTDVAQPLTTQDLDNPSWRLIGHWHLIQQVIRSVLGMFPNGVFVEVGAGDGAFLSHTAWLEKEMNWTGLLIEPRPWSYQTLRKRRKAMGARVCVSDVAFNHKDLLWTPKHTESMPYEYRSITEGKATLFRYVAEEDRPSGDLSSIQCFTLDALLTAAGLGPKKMVHLLVLHTMGGEGKILDTLESANIMFLVVRDRGGIDRKDIFYAVDRLNLTLFKDIPEELDNFLFFINKEVEIVKKEKSEEAEL